MLFSMPSSLFKLIRAKRPFGLLSCHDTENWQKIDDFFFRDEIPSPLPSLNWRNAFCCLATGKIEREIEERKFLSGEFQMQMKPPGHERIKAGYAKFDDTGPTTTPECITMALGQTSWNIHRSVDVHCRHEADRPPVGRAFIIRRVIHL